MIGPVSQFQYDVIKHNLYSELCVLHDFQKERICVVPVAVELENDSKNEVEVLLELLLSAETTIG